MLLQNEWDRTIAPYSPHLNSRTIYMLMTPVTSNRQADNNPHTLSK